MRLYYHAESDSLYWDEFQSDPFVEDVTDSAAYQDMAAARGLKCPGPISRVIEAGNQQFDAIGKAASRTMRGCGTVWKDDPPVAVKKSGGLAGAITSSYRAWERKPSDFYPTPHDVTESLMPVIKTLLPNGGKIWEPACGDMDMSRVLEWHGYEVTSTDLRYTGQGIGGIDFLHDDPEEKWGWIPDPDMIVSNPPFNLAAEFIMRALSYTPNVAMLLKIDYWNAISRLPLFDSHRPAFFLPLTWRPAFLEKERGKSPLMNCAWVVWSDQGFEDHCVMEPIKKLAYPGHKGDGIRTALAKLMQAVDDLASVVAECPR